MTLQPERQIPGTEVGVLEPEPITFDEVLEEIQASLDIEGELGAVIIPFENSVLYGYTGILLAKMAQKTPDGYVLTDEVNTLRIDLDQSLIEREEYDKVEIKKSAGKKQYYYVVYGNGQSCNVVNKVDYVTSAINPEEHRKFVEGLNKNITLEMTIIGLMVNIANDPNLVGFEMIDDRLKMPEDYARHTVSTIRRAA